jgi:hypothetical protein
MAMSKVFKIESIYVYILLSNIFVAGFVYFLMGLSSYIRGFPPKIASPYKKTGGIPEKSTTLNSCNVIKINECTQSYPNSYRSIGTVTNTEKSSILPLFGRRNLNFYNYYCETNDFQKIKVAVHSGSKNCFSEYGCSQLSNGDTVEIPELGSGLYVVTIHENCVHRYIPHISC